MGEAAIVIKIAASPPPKSSLRHEVVPLDVTAILFLRMVIPNCIQTPIKSVQNLKRDEVILLFSLA